MTTARAAIVDVVLSAHAPVGAKDVLATLRAQKVRADVTTVYRELEFLREQGVLSTVTFDDGVQRYESSDLGHHHHLVCTACKRIQDVVVPHEQLHIAEREILRTHRFSVLQHSLDFYGHCDRCR